MTPAASPGPTSRHPARRGVDASALRRHNLGALVEHLHHEGPASRSELGAASGLSRSTILDLVQDLVARNLVFEEGRSSSTGPGRPSPIVHIRPEGAVVVAVELGVEDVAVATIGLGGHVFDHVRVDLPARARRPMDITRRVVRLAGGLVDKGPARDIAGVGVAVPGLTRRRDGFVHLAPNLGWKDVEFGAMLADAFALPATRVMVANEADLGALGELRRGAGRSRQNLVFVSGGVGIGASVIVGGRPLLGAAGYAGEAGHMIVNPAGRPCTCGATGCWETEAGGAALVRAAGGSSTGGPAEVRAIADRLEAGDRAASRAVRTTGRWLGLGIGNLVNLFNPEMVVLGGFYQALFPQLEQPMLEALRQQALDEIADLVTVVPSILGTSAQLHGAAELCLASVLWDPTA